MIKYPKVRSLEVHRMTGTEEAMTGSGESRPGWTAPAPLKVVVSDVRGFPLVSLTLSFLLPLLGLHLGGLGGETGVGRRGRLGDNVGLVHDVLGELAVSHVAVVRHLDAVGPGRADAG